MATIRLSASEAAAALATWQASGVSLRAYCRRRGWNPERLRYWQRRSDPATRPPSGFVEVRPDGRDGHLEISMANGARIQVCTGFDPTLLRAVVEALA